MKEETKTAVVEFTLEPDASAVPRALAALDELEGCLSADEMEDVRLLVGELVTNAVLHAGLGPDDEIRAKVSASPDVVRGEVREPGPGLEARGSGFRGHPGPRPDQTSGRGLFVVDKISERWGTERHDGLNRVWFELSRADDGRSRSDGGTPPRRSTGLVGSFSASVRDGEGVLVVEARGEADLAAYDALLAAIEEAAERAGDPPRAIVVDLVGATYLDSLGLGVLIGSTAGPRGRGGKVHVVAPEGPCRRLLGIMGLDRIFRVHDDLPSALRGTKQG